MSQRSEQRHPTLRLENASRTAASRNAPCSPCSRISRSTRLRDTRIRLIVGSISWAKKGARRLRDFVGPAEFGVLAPQPAQLLDLRGGRQVAALPAVGLGLANPGAQRFVVHAQLLGQPPDHRARVGLEVQADGALTQLVWVLLRCSHRDSLHGLRP